MPEIAAGGFHNCVRRPNARVSCWGWNAFGQVGIDTAVTVVSSPTTLPNLANVTSLALGSRHSCALRTGGDIRCWGRNDRGQLGDGGLSNSAVPVTVVFP
ncbi:MAG: RCC1 domain-containing protein [Roseinatronobacter sp.]